MPRPRTKVSPSPAEGGGFAFVPISHPSESAAWKKKVRSHAARNHQARRQRVVAYQQTAVTLPTRARPSTTIDGQDSDGGGASSSRPEAREVAFVSSGRGSGSSDSNYGNAHPLLHINSPMSPLGAARADPFNSFHRVVTPWEQKLLDHFMQYMVMKEMACMPSLNLDILGDKAAFWRSMSAHWVQASLSDRGMLASTLLWACRHMALVQHRDIFDPQATRYRLECIQMLNQTLTREGRNISNLTITKTLALASDSNLMGEHDVADQHLKAVGSMIRMQDEGGSPSDFLGRLVIWFTRDSNPKSMMGRANLDFNMDMTPVAKVEKDLVYHVNATTTSVIPVVLVLRVFIAQLRVGVVGVPTPVGLGHGAGDRRHPPDEERVAGRGVGPVARRVVELPQEHLVAVRVRRRRVSHLRRLGVPAAVHVDQDEPAGGRRLGRGQIVVDEGPEAVLRDRLGQEARGVERVGRPLRARRVEVRPVGEVRQLAGPVRLGERAAADVDAQGREELAQDAARPRLGADVEAVKDRAAPGDEGAHVELGGHVALGVRLEARERRDQPVLLQVEGHAEPGDDARGGEGVEPELGDDAERRAGAADGPEEVRVLVLRGLDRLSVGRDDGRLDDPVRRQAVKMRAEAVAAVDAVTRHADSEINGPAALFEQLRRHVSETSAGANRTRAL
ncbi:hypothetical protein CTA2_3169 [Colletotrichum tanaceti]|uniref:Uncharacterized protein n=1 Tax=Colletotrichum tanaceti TaxID=1306861 RepID=A0A4U6XNY5_9PEZI|nr:hypothetical protein CTA2_3169 [Colletotrichum tanaceti]TKW57457.1 hypothetical protein CTA1_8506 [Colletotrichum tanaceti]